jgi:hypothetical protein
VRSAPSTEQRSKMVLRVEAISARLAAARKPGRQALRISSEVTCPLVVLEPGFPTLSLLLNVSIDGFCSMRVLLTHSSHLLPAG